MFPQDKAGSTDFDVGPFQGEDTYDVRNHNDNGHSSSGGGRRGGGGGGGDSSRVRGFHDMICIGFAVSLCLNLGSFTARQEGYFAAEVRCLPQGASQTVLVSTRVGLGFFFRPPQSSIAALPLLRLGCILFRYSVLCGTPAATRPFHHTPTAVRRLSMRRLYLT